MINYPIYDIRTILIEAFGMNAYGQINMQGKDPANIDYGKIILKDDEIEMVKSPLGTNTFKPIKFKGGNYKKLSLSNELPDTYGFTAFELPVTTLIDFTRAKNIIRTPILGGTGSVKELYGFDDWQINIRTVCLNTKGRTATNWKHNLLTWEMVVEGIEVEGDVFAEKDISHIVINQMNIKQIEGKPWMIPIEIQAESATPFELNGNN